MLSNVTAIQSHFFPLSSTSNFAAYIVPTHTYLVVSNRLTNYGKYYSTNDSTKKGRTTPCRKQNIGNERRWDKITYLSLDYYLIDIVQHTRDMVTPMNLMKLIGTSRSLKLQNKVRMQKRCKNCCHQPRSLQLYLQYFNIDGPINVLPFTLLHDGLHVHVLPEDTYNQVFSHSWHLKNLTKQSDI